MTIFSRLTLAAAAALLAPLSVGAAPPASVPVTQADNGAMLIGDPAAKVRLVEYISYTCPHCAAFTAEAHGILVSNYAAPRKVAIEIRNLVRDPFDMTAALLARCAGPRRFAGAHTAILAAQESWMNKARAATPAQQKAWTSGPIESRLIAIGRGTGLTALVGRHGVTPAAAARCLSDKAARDRLVAMTGGAKELGVTGTPSFLLNGTLSTAHDWAGLQPELLAVTR